MSELLGKNRNKFIIFCAGVLLMFFTSMSKVLVPGTIFNELQSELGISGGMLAGMGAAYMYAYAASQLGLGLLSTRYGGVRILLFGGGCFTVGCVLFPMLSNPWLMALVRALTGLGAGTVFVALAKLINDLFPKQFGLVLGISLFLSYFGPVTGGLPMVSLVKSTSWRFAMAVPAAISLFVMLLILLFLKGTMKPVIPGQTIAPLWEIMRNKYSLCLFVTSSVIFGSYYAILTTMGQKSLEDYVFGKTNCYASVCITVLAVIVAANNIVTNLVLKLIGGRRRVLLLFAAVTHLLGTLLGAAAFAWNMHWFWIILAFVLIAIPAGFFSIFSIIVKEQNKPEYVGLAVAILNCFAFIAIALVGNIAGWVLSKYEAVLKPSADGTFLYPAATYRDIFLVFAVFATAGMITALFIPETKDNA